MGRKRGAAESPYQHEEVAVGSDVWIGYGAVILTGDSWAWSNSGDWIGGDAGCFTIFDSRWCSCEGDWGSIFNDEIMEHEARVAMGSSFFRSVVSTIV